MDEKVESHSQNYLEEHRESLTKMASDIQGVLNDNLIGFYLTGSLATGDWNPETSDIDVCIVTQEPLNDSEKMGLEALHQASVKVPIGRKIEGEYVTLRSLQTKDYSETVGSITAGSFSMKQNNLSNDNLVGLNQNSIAIIGPRFESLGVVVTEEELKEAEYQMLEEDRDEAATENDFTKKLYLLINSLRCIYTLKTGKLPTKRGAVESGKALIGDELYRNLQRYFSGEREQFEIPNQTLVALIETGLSLRQS